MLTEQQAHDEVLRRCQVTPGGGWVMRSAPENPIPGYEWTAKHRVSNLSPVAVAPHREIVAEGNTWKEVLQMLDTAPKKC